MLAPDEPREAGSSFLLAVTGNAFFLFVGFASGAGGDKCPHTPEMGSKGLARKHMCGQGACDGEFPPRGGGGFE